MDYDSIRLEDIKIDKAALDKAKKDDHWQNEAAPGIFREIWHVDAKKQRPAFMHKMDGVGIKHGVNVNYADKRMGKLTKALKPMKVGWKDYLLSEIDKNPILAASKDACIYDWPNIAVYIWTSNEEEVPVLLSEVSKAIRKLAGGDEAGGDSANLNGELQSALDDGDAEGYAEQFIELMGEGSTKEIAAAFDAACTLLEGDINPLLLGAMAAATIKIGTKPLKDFVKKAELAEQIQDMDDDFNEEFILALQQAYTYATSEDGLANKELVKRYYDNISEIMKICGYKVKKSSIMT
ncbi:MAG: hypothetical protein LBV04_04840, partial [Deferribacteraceae bacterium]|nr:hypothetical protein [Deferribacteraceae bacterium]